MEPRVRPRVYIYIRFAVILQMARMRFLLWFAKQKKFTSLNFSHQNFDFDFFFVFHQSRLCGHFSIIYIFLKIVKGCTSPKKVGKPNLYIPWFVTVDMAHRVLLTIVLLFRPLLVIGPLAH